METTQNCKWRSASRCVAYIDLALITIAIIGFTVFIFAYVFIIAPELFKYTEDVIVVVVIGIIVLVLTAFAFWVTKLLLDATKPDVDAQVAGRKATLWMSINIVFTFFDLFFHTVQADFVAVVATIIIRGVFISIVYKFIWELNKAECVPV